MARAQEIGGGHVSQQDVDDGDIFDIEPPSYEWPRTVPAPVFQYTLMSITQVLDRASPRWLVRKLIRRGETVVIFGDPSTGKTFIALDLVLSIASDVAWWGYGIVQGPVLYFAGEGVAGLGKRIMAWGMGHPNVDLRSLDFRVLAEAIALIDDETFERVLATVKAMATKPVVIVIDTLARYLIGGDENSALDTGKFLDRCARLGAATGAAVVIIHHKRKGAAVERGSSAIRGAADVMWEVTYDGEVTTIVGSKAKDAMLMEPLYLKRKVEWLGTDEDGESVSSLRFEVGEAPEPKEKGKAEATPAEVADHSADHDAQLRKTLAEVFGGRGSGGALRKASGLKQNQHYDALKRSITDGTVRRLDDSRFPEYELTDKAPEYVVPPPTSLKASLDEFANSDSNSDGLKPSKSVEFEFESAGPRKGAADHKLKLDLRGRTKLRSRNGSKQKGRKREPTKPHQEPHPPAPDDSKLDEQDGAE